MSTFCLSFPFSFAWDFSWDLLLQKFSLFHKFFLVSFVLKYPVDVKYLFCNEN